MDLPVLRTHQSSRLLLRSYYGLSRSVCLAAESLSCFVDVRGRNDSSYGGGDKFVRSLRRT